MLTTLLLACSNAPAHPHHPRTTAPSDTSSVAAIDTATTDSGLTGPTGPPEPLSWVWAAQGGDGQACGLVSDGTTRCWGRAGWTDQAPPQTVKFLQLSESTAACGVQEDGTIACWCPDAKPDVQPICDKVPTGVYTRVEVGAGLACAQRGDGTLKCWGNVDAHSHQPDPTEPVIDFDLEEESACAVFDDGHLGCWYDPPTWDDATMTLPEGTFTEVAVGRTFLCGLDTAGDMRCAGHTWDTGVFAPALFPGPFTTIDSDYLTTCGLKPDGHPDCWWSSSTAAPYYVVPDVAFADIRLSSGGGCGVDPDGQAFCWLDPSAPDQSVVDVPPL